MHATCVNLHVIRIYVFVQAQVQGRARQPARGRAGVGRRGTGAPSQQAAAQPWCGSKRGREKSRGGAAGAAKRGRLGTGVRGGRGVEEEEEEEEEEEQVVGVRADEGDDKSREPSDGEHESPPKGALKKGKVGAARGRRRHQQQQRQQQREGADEGQQGSGVGQPSLQPEGGGPKAMDAGSDSEPTSADSVLPRPPSPPR